ncbi:MAG TPA: hypothetical protein VKE74_21300 [Gemmataceae bacterium]|nr:hypothetical protein [Gemmataceae bacterium]
MDELIKMVSEKAGINPEQAKNAVNAVFEFVKNKMPMIGDQLKAVITGGGGGGLGDIAGKLGGILGK